MAIVDAESKLYSRSAFLDKAKSLVGGLGTGLFVGGTLGFGAYELTRPKQIIYQDASVNPVEVISTINLEDKQINEFNQKFDTLFQALKESGAQNVPNLRSYQEGYRFDYENRTYFLINSHRALEPRPDSVVIVTSTKTVGTGQPDINTYFIVEENQLTKAIQKKPGAEATQESVENDKKPDITFELGELLSNLETDFEKTGK